MKNQRTMVKIATLDNSIVLRTFSRDYQSPQRFIILNSELEELKIKKSVIVSDIYSFAILRLHQTPTGMDVIDIDFSWLSSSVGRSLIGQKEFIRLSYERFLNCIEESSQLDGQYTKLLSIPDDNKPKIEFMSRNNLKEVTKRKRLRRQLGKFLNQHFNWVNSQSILITDESIPYSFFFIEKKVHGNGICGGIILHGSENHKTAYYSIHT